MAVRLHLEALHEDVLDDPEPFLFDDLDHLELVAAPDVGEGQIAGRRDVPRSGAVSIIMVDRPFALVAPKVAGDLSLWR